MTYSRPRFRWRLLAAAALLSVPMFAAPAEAQVYGGQSDAGRQLSQHLNILSADPHNVRALIGAGDAALALEDPNGAIGFFGRADEIDPRNGRVKAGLGRALVMLEKPREALRLFDQATDLGVHEMDIARDRGLAYDLRGDQKRAQRDYALAMRRGADPELTRRMALSLGISGERDQALKLLDPLLYKQDKAAWRARAFILAMSGDVNGANGIARQVMPGNLARPMGAFFQRLGALSAAQKAAAVHYGQMPSDGKSDGLVYAYDDSANARLASVDGGLIPAGEPLGPRAADPTVSKTPAKVSREARRRPGRTNEAQRLTAAAPTPAGPLPAPAATSPVVAPPAAAKDAVRTEPGTQSQTPQMAARLDTRLSTRISPPTPAQAQAIAGLAEAKPVLMPGMTALPPPSSGLAAATAPVGMTISAPVPAVAQSSFSLPAGTATTAQAAPQLAAATPAPPPQPVGTAPAPATPQLSAATPRPSLADIIGGLELETPVIVEPPAPVVRTASIEPKPATAKSVDPKKPEAKKAAEKKPTKPDPKKAEPSRIWAQIAAGRDKAALARDYQKMAKKASAAFKGKTAWTAPFRSSRRLLVGPFDSQKKAQDFLDKAEIKGFAWTSTAGEPVEKLALK